MHAHPRAASQRCAAEIAARAGVAGDGLDGLADEGLDQQRLGFLLGKAARPQIEQQALVERAGGRAMAAGDVVGEDFQFRLVVGFGLVGQQQRPRHHLGVGLLRVRADDDVALEHRMAAVVDHRAEDLAAVAVRHRVIHEQRACRRAGGRSAG